MKIKNYKIIAESKQILQDFVAELQKNGYPTMGCEEILAKEYFDQEELTTLRVYLSSFKYDTIHRMIKILESSLCILYFTEEERNLRKADRLIKKIETFFEITQSIASLSTSTKLKVGALAVSKDFQKMAAIGYNGTVPNSRINFEIGSEEKSLESGKSGFIHAEQNLCIKFHENDPQNYFILLTHSPCEMCMDQLIIAGFKDIYWIEEYRKTEHLIKMNDYGIKFGNPQKMYENLLQELYG